MNARDFKVEGTEVSRLANFREPDPGAELKLLATIKLAGGVWVRESDLNVNETLLESLKDKGEIDRAHGYVRYLSETLFAEREQRREIQRERWKSRGWGEVVVIETEDLATLLAVSTDIERASGGISGNTESSNAAIAYLLAAQENIAKALKELIHPSEAAGVK